jgi:hypothetical protein
VAQIGAETAGRVSWPAVSVTRLQRVEELFSDLSINHRRLDHKTVWSIKGVTPLVLIRVIIKQTET